MNLIDNLKELNAAYESGNEDGSLILELVEKTELKHIERNELANLRLHAGVKVFLPAFIVGLVCFEVVMLGFKIDLQNISNPIIAFLFLIVTLACGMIGRIYFGLASDSVTKRIFNDSMFKNYREIVSQRIPR